MTLDLRYLALILDAGARSVANLEDTGLHTALSRMSKEAAEWAISDPGPFGYRNLAEEFDVLARRLDEFDDPAAGRSVR